MRAAGLIDGGQAKTDGVGAMSDQDWADAFEVATEAGLYPRTMDYKRGYTLQFLGGAK
jgi:NitT/TauT family transport system substrate-binding protein